MILLQIFDIKSCLFRLHVPSMEDFKGKIFLMKFTLCHAVIVEQVTWLIAPENMSHTSALKLSGTPLSIRSWVLTVRYIQTPLEDAKTRTTSQIQMRFITLLMDTYCMWTPLLSRHLAMVAITYKYNIFIVLYYYLVVEHRRIN